MTRGIYRLLGGLALASALPPRHWQQRRRSRHQARTHSRTIAVDEGGRPPPNSAGICNRWHAPPNRRLS